MTDPNKGKTYGAERIRRRQARVNNAEQEILALLRDQSKGKHLSPKAQQGSIFDAKPEGGATLQDLYRETRFALGYTLMDPLLQKLRREGKILYDENEECYKIGLSDQSG